MKKLIPSLKNITLAVGFAAAATLFGCVDPNSNSYPNSYGNGYGSPGYGTGYGDPYYRERRDIDRDRIQADRDRHEVEKEAERVERERRRVDEERNRQYTPPARRQESCPSGYSPSERKCSSEERKHGCHDMRLPGGLGCVSR